MLMLILCKSMEKAGYLNESQEGRCYKEGWGGYVWSCPPGLYTMLQNLYLTFGNKNGQRSLKIFYAGGNILNILQILFHLILTAPLCSISFFYFHLTG